jgi:hypothetical protein
MEAVMNKVIVAQQAQTAGFLPPAQGLLRKCTGGNHVIAGGECAECAKNKRVYNGSLLLAEVMIRWNRKQIGLLSR